MGGEADPAHAGPALEVGGAAGHREGGLHGGGLQPRHERALCQAPSAGPAVRHSGLPAPAQPERYGCARGCGV